MSRLTEHTRSSKRPYTLRERARSQEATRRRIAEAALKLHSTVGPTATTISAVAELAGVERLTVYRHFPDQDALFTGCSSLHFERDPPPDPASWQSIRHPEQRLRTALGELFAYNRRNARLLANLRRDIDALPALVAKRLASASSRSAEVLMDGWGARGSKRRRLRAVLRHAVEYETWRSVVQDGVLTDAEAIELMVGLVRLALR